MGSRESSKAKEIHPLKTPRNRRATGAKKALFHPVSLRADSLRAMGELLSESNGNIYDRMHHGLFFSLLYTWWAEQWITHCTSSSMILHIGQVTLPSSLIRSWLSCAMFPWDSLLRFPSASTMLIIITFWGRRERILTYHLMRNPIWVKISSLNSYLWLLFLWYMRSGHYFSSEKESELTKSSMLSSSSALMRLCISFGDQEHYFIFF